MADARGWSETDPAAGGAIFLGAPTARRWGVIHIGPEPGYCSVDDEGCGYCIGVPCRLPKKDLTSNGGDDARDA